MIPAILLYTNLNFCSELKKASTLQDGQQVERVLKEHLNQTKPKDPWTFFQVELRKCGIEMKVPKDKTSS